MNHLTRSELHAASLEHAVSNLSTFFTLTIAAEDEGAQEVDLLQQECQRWGLIASILVTVGVNDTCYADN
jgi:hypothetical protein